MIYWNPFKQINGPQLSRRNLKLHSFKVPWPMVCSDSSCKCPAAWRWSWRNMGSGKAIAPNCQWPEDSTHAAFTHENNMQHSEAFWGEHGEQRGVPNHCGLQNWKGMIEGKPSNSKMQRDDINVISWWSKMPEDSFWDKQNVAPNIKGPWSPQQHDELHKGSRSRKLRPCHGPKGLQGELCGTTKMQLLSWPYTVTQPVLLQSLFLCQKHSDHRTAVPKNGILNWTIYWFSLMSLIALQISQHFIAAVV